MSTTSTPDAVCPHRRVREHGRPQVYRGAPVAGHTPDPQSRTPGYHIAHAGTCEDCGWPVLRVSEHVALGAWHTVANGAPRVRTRRYG